MLSAGRSILLEETKHKASYGGAMTSFPDRRRDGKVRATSVLSDRTNQRSKDRYPIELELQYKLLRKSRVERLGVGKTLNMSSHGVLIETDQPLPPSGWVELAIKWPFLLEGGCGLKLVMRGRIVRCDASIKATAVRTDYHELRTAGVQSFKTLPSGAASR